jgi:hypothetical protein
MLFCRSCRQTYSEGTNCPRCDAELVPADPADRTDEDAEMVAVLRTSDSNLMPVVKSVLDAAGIPYVVQGDEAMGLLPLGPFGGGVFSRVLGASILVPADRAEEALALLESFEQPDEAP